MRGGPFSRSFTCVRATSRAGGVQNPWAISSRLPASTTVMLR